MPAASVSTCAAVISISQLLSSQMKVSFADGASLNVWLAPVPFACGEVALGAVIRMKDSRDVKAHDLLAASDPMKPGLRARRWSGHWSGHWRSAVDLLDSSSEPGFA
jgi:hypothetical protein